MNRFANVIICLVCLSSFWLPKAASHDNNNEIELFIFAGQSNMQGWKGDGKHYPEDKHNLDDSIKLYWTSPGISSSNKSWTHLKAQDGRFEQGHFGPEVSFSRAIAARGISIAVFKYTLGGTNLANDWNKPGAGGMYDHMVTELAHAIKLLKREFHSVKIKSFIWVQGESDAKTVEMANAYASNLKL